MRECTKCHSQKDEKEFYKKVRSWCKDCFNLYCHERWKIRKLDAVNLLGGKCSNCGYNQNLAALDFHHVDPTTKDSNWHSFCKYPWAKIVNELSKCILLCRNCHAELHNPNQSISVLETIETDSNATLNRNAYKVVIHTGICQREGCQVPVYGTKFCSKECSGFSQRKVARPSKKDLILQLQSDSMVKIGKRYGVSDNAVRKWIKAYSIEQL